MEAGHAKNTASKYTAKRPKEERFMKDYMVKDIRNIAVLGHGSEGKTTLVEAMLYAAGVIDRQGLSLIHILRTDAGFPVLRICRI